VSVKAGSVGYPRREAAGLGAVPGRGQRLPFAKTNANTPQKQSGLVHNFPNAAKIDLNPAKQIPLLKAFLFVMFLLI